jgi:hypothetical protein
MSIGATVYTDATINLIASWMDNAKFAIRIIIASLSQFST